MCSVRLPRGSARGKQADRNGPDEEAFRFNERHDDDGGRFQNAIKGIVGRRVTYKALIGSELSQTWLKKPSRNSNAVDVPADDPVGTIDRFTDGLRRVLAVPKSEMTKSPRFARKKARTKRRA